MHAFAPRSAALALATVVAVAAHAESPTNTRGLDRRNLDESTPACADFYQYANGSWLAANPVPDDQSRWATSSELRERNYSLLREILDDAAEADAPADTHTGKVGRFWTAAMDVDAIEAAGAAPIEKDLARIAAIEDAAGVAAFVRDMHRAGAQLLFNLAIIQDLKDTTRYLSYAVQGGVGLPERDYYLRDDDESVALRGQYQRHVAAMLELLGDSPEVAAAGAEAVLALETRFAENSLGAVELRNPANFYNVRTVAEADADSPLFSWSQYFASLGLADLESFSYAQPKFFATVNDALADVPIETWRSYLRWHLINAFAPYLSDAFSERDFDFFGRTLQGARERQPRWKRMIDQTSASLGEALGQVYVERAFPPETKKRADAMIENLRDTVRARISALEWMSDATKAQALRKLDAFRSKIGYPDEWRDYSALHVGSESYAGNVRAADAFEMRRNLDKIGQPIDQNEWGMSPQTINAYYNPVANEIVFPAAIMQPPFFDGTIDDAVNYGAMGAVIGHEFMHGFDDQGSRFDAEGNMQNWWTDEDRARFEERANRLVAQYDGFVAIDDLHVNGKLTLGENIGDLAGLTMAYYALQRALDGVDRATVDGWTPEQRFFLSFAQAWRANYRDEFLKLQVNTDPHSPSKFRANGPLANMPEFAQAFGCQAGDPMVLSEEKRADIW